MLRRATAVDPEERYASASEMLIEVRRALRECGDDDPRTKLAALMQRFFSHRAEYARAALRESTPKPGRQSSSMMGLDAVARRATLAALEQQTADLGTADPRVALSTRAARHARGSKIRVQRTCAC